jgi:hypothetical protein
MKIHIGKRFAVNRPSRRILGVGLLLGLLALGQPENAFAQTGSTGGIVGKQNKEVSGDAPSPESKSRALSPALSPRPHVTEPGRITVTSATLGANCGVRRGNVTSRVAEICNGHDACQVPGSKVNNPDPAFGCAKAFSAQWKCSAGGKTKSATVAAIALETNVLTLTCN